MEDEVLNMTASVPPSNTYIEITLSLVIAAISDTLYGDKYCLECFAIHYSVNFSATVI
jgi:hypothetical protein